MVNPGSYVSESGSTIASIGTVSASISMTGMQKTERASNRHLSVFLYQLSAAVFAYSTWWPPYFRIFRT
ncbi:hypothetical protein BO223_06705 [Faecalibaculum rodentium]|uniref:Uncharacterized protein n=1 Tax=Faecalibaculum rodentium TaxID=1702221 RepID=A0A1Q9YK39_9FIRM|nr:hypothetical protein BO223_06705 [Faecalibaculum rodentium]